MDKDKIEELKYKLEGLENELHAIEEGIEFHQSMLNELDMEQSIVENKIANLYDELNYLQNTVDNK